MCLCSYGFPWYLRFLVSRVPLVSGFPPVFRVPLVFTGAPDIYGFSLVSGSPLDHLPAGMSVCHDTLPVDLMLLVPIAGARPGASSTSCSRAARSKGRLVRLVRLDPVPLARLVSLATLATRCGSRARVARGGLDPAGARGFMRVVQGDLMSGFVLVSFASA